MDTAGNGICGWELNNFEPELFETRILEVSGKCKECPYLSQCRVPSESIRCLVPKEGELVELGREHAEDGKIITYFALVQTGGTRFIQLLEPEHYWARASWVDKDDVPYGRLSLLERRLGESSGTPPCAHQGQKSTESPPP